jgi:restriction system protein
MHSLVIVPAATSAKVFVSLNRAHRTLPNTISALHSQLPLAAGIRPWASDCGLLLGASRRVRVVTGEGVLGLGVTHVPHPAVTSSRVSASSLRDSGDTLANRGCGVPVPDYQTLMAPVLHMLSDGQARSKRELIDLVTAHVGLTEEDLREGLPSGVTVADSRVDWAVTYLVQAGLVRRPRRAVVEITDRGQKVLKAHPDRVDNAVLDHFEEFRTFKTRSRDRSRTRSTAAQDNVEAPPREKIAGAVEEANEVVATDVLERVRQCGPVFLEQLVLRVLTAMGYGGPPGSARHLGGSRDGGVDGVIRQDPLGLDQIYVQAKRYAADRSIGRPDIQAFVGALHGAQADRGIFVTTSHFTADAVEYAERVNARLVLIDGAALAQLMVRYNIGVQDQETYVLKRIDEDFFDET